MSNKVVSDLEEMGKDRRKAEEAYIEEMEYKVEVQRIQREGISNVEDLITYTSRVIEEVKHAETVARVANNSIMYSEAIGIRREFEKLLNLVLMDGTAVEQMDGTEEKHRENNKGEEGYV